MEVTDPTAVPSNVSKTSGKTDFPSPADLKKARLAQARRESGPDFAKLVDRVGETRQNASAARESVRVKLEEIAQTLNREMQFRERNLNFSVDKISNRILFSVTDKESGEVIRQVPPEAVLKVSHNLEALKGVLFDDKY